MDRITFDNLLRDLITHLYDSVALETHPLTAATEIPADYRGRRGEYLREKISTAIELLRPPNTSFYPNVPEGRAYIILQKRYIEGISPPLLAAQLALSERQLRRDHSRALEALSQRLWEQLFPSSSAETAPSDAEVIEIIAPDFTLNPEALDLIEVLKGVLSILETRILAEEIQVDLHLDPSQIWNVLADRIVLRQILFSLFTCAFQVAASQLIDVELSVSEANIHLEIQFDADEQDSLANDASQANLIKTAQSWGQKMNVQIEKTPVSLGGDGRTRLVISIPSASQNIILVVDDQKATLRMYQRYLNRTTLKVIGIDDPTQALKTACHLQPALILLDVMMPLVDGWEILQSLRSNAQTQNIPIIVCSAWEAADLARSLGAVNFLKKPITQRELLNALQQVNLLAENSA